MPENAPTGVPALLRPSVAVLAGRPAAVRTVLALLPVAVPAAVAVLAEGAPALLATVVAAVAAVLGTAALAWLSVLAERDAAAREVREDTAVARYEAGLLAASEQLEEQARDAFVQQQFTEKQSRRRAQEVVDDSSSTIVERLSEVEGQVGTVQASTDVIDERAAAAAAATRDILDQAERADRDVEALEDSLRSVESMAAVIAQVAGQTKLLALNATIEAARAGAAGDGFRVVAAEVKDLAATTAGSTHEISTTVAAVQANAHAVLRSLRAVQDRIPGIDEVTTGLRSVADQQRDALLHLRGSVAAAVEGARQMGDLAATMERRRASRYPCHQDVVVLVEEMENPGTALDLGLGGARVDVRTTRRVGVGTRVEVRWPHGGRSLDLAGAVARTSPVPGGHEVGIVFDVAGAQAPAALLEVLGRLKDRAEAPRPR